MSKYTRKANAVEALTINAAGPLFWPEAAGMGTDKATGEKHIVFTSNSPAVPYIGFTVEAAEIMVEMLTEMIQIARGNGEKGTVSNN